MFPPERIVWLTEETVETLYLLGEQDCIVGNPDLLTALQYGGYPGGKRPMRPSSGTGTVVSSANSFEKAFAPRLLRTFQMGCGFRRSVQSQRNIGHAIPEFDLLSVEDDDQ